jgi:hypothetical protein
MDQAAVKPDAGEKKQCSPAEKEACGWENCTKEDCEKHAWLWDTYSVSYFYES